MPGNCSKTLGVLQAYLKNYVYGDSMKLFLLTQWNECCYQTLDAETGESMISFQCFIIHKAFTKSVAPI